MFNSMIVGARQSFIKLYKSVGKTQYYIKHASQNHEYDIRCI